MLCTLMILPAQAERKMKKEFEALEEARQLLTSVNDEKSAIAAVKAITKTFDAITPEYGAHSSAVLTQLHDRQNIINRMMVLLSKQPYFESSGLQACWALIVHPEARRYTQRDKARGR